MNECGFSFCDYHSIDIDEAKFKKIPIIRTISIY